MRNAILDILLKFQKLGFCRKDRRSRRVISTIIKIILIIVEVPHYRGMSKPVSGLPISVLPLFYRN